MDSDQLTINVIANRARREFGNRTIVSALDGDTAEITYKQLFQRVDRLAHALRQLGVRPGSRVGTLAWNHQRHLELYLAVTMSGAVLHTINLRLSIEQIYEMADHAGDMLIFCDSDVVDVVAASLPTGIQLVALSGTPESGNVIDYEQLLAQQPDDRFTYPELDERMPAATCYSSATTGQPKGVVYSHRGLVLHSMMLAMADTWGVSEADSILPIVPMFHVNAWGLPFAALWMGSELVLPGPRPAPRDLVYLMQAHAVTLAAAVPTVWSGILGEMRSLGCGLPDLRLAVSGGAPLPQAILTEAESLGVSMIHSYGMTEASPLVLVNRRRREVDDTKADGSGNQDLRLKQGYVVPGLDYRILDSDGNSVPRDGSTPGELLLRGPWVAEEYERDARSKTAFANGWYHTGDIVTIDPHGYVQVVDRLADLIKSGGEWISSIDLENALMAHPAVAVAAVIAVPDERWQERPRAYIVCHSDVNYDTLCGYLEARFPKFWIPDQIIQVDEIPMTSVGKFDKKELRRRSNHGSASIDS